ncbi:I78 family peptidase inhibitor [Qipengyuania atrilutea]|uniref:Peptidase inhibitor I78 n=1 Tax=Qipengyuania atrilutea TaxID=2744473 RepID=A0A850H4H0_9SPHN|nr:I78 family peptidase inhibitor [Actirhodobacter atriluteus]NVD45546.1 peptidase inhibitor I78 [Actirhodobacter atriluteus]
MKSLLATLPFLLAGCTAANEEPQTPVAVPDGDGKCEAAAAQSLVGERATSETGGRVLSLTGADTLRWGPPGAMFTMDYRPDRVTVMYDDAMMITQIKCG